LSENETIEYAKNILTGLLSAVSKRFKKIIQPVTAGWDSRLLLAASKHLSSKINYYLFTNIPGKLKNPDVIIGSKLAENLNLDFQKVAPVKLKKEFLEKYSEICINPRYLPKTSQIQWHYYENSDKDAVNINGSGGEIIRRVYQYFEKDDKVDVDTLLRCRKYNDFFKSEVEKWYDETLPVSIEHKINLLDLF